MPISFFEWPSFFFTAPATKSRTAVIACKGGRQHEGVSICAFSTLFEKSSMKIDPYYFHLATTKTMTLTRFSFSTGISIYGPILHV